MTHLFTKIRIALGTLIALSLLVSVAGCGPDADDMALRAAVDNSMRPAADRERDMSRHPYETLKFLGVKPNHMVVELWPGSGWYSRILAPYLADKGSLNAAHFAEATDSEYRKKSRMKFVEASTSNPIYKYMTVGTLDYNPDLDLYKASSADVVLTFRNLHNWEKAGKLKMVFEKAFKALKPGGIFGVVEHRKVDATPKEMADSGYMDPEYVLNVADMVGFNLAGSSEINANPMDTADHPRGVWTLPPSYALKDKDREKYAAIGESDRFTYKFVKPGR